MIHQLKALLLAVDDDLVKMRCPKLLGFDYQVIGMSIREVDLHLEFIDLLAGRSINLSDVTRVQTLNPLDHGI